MTVNGYLIKDYTDTPEDGKPILNFVFGEKELFKIIDKAKTEDRKITVFEIGECLIDWS